jgi:hypothetical protein
MGGWMGFSLSRGWWVKEGPSRGKKRNMNFPVEKISSSLYNSFDALVCKTIHFLLLLKTERLKEEIPIWSPSFELHLVESLIESISWQKVTQMGNCCTS